MAHRIIKQPNGRYALWSTNVDNFLLTDATPEEIIDYKVNLFRKDITDMVNITTQKLDNGEKPYYQFTLTFEKALEVIKRVHGNERR